jgi:hypothetical protein
VERPIIYIKKMERMPPPGAAPTATQDDPHVAAAAAAANPVLASPFEVRPFLPPSKACWQHRPCALACGQQQLEPHGIRS